MISVNLDRRTSAIWACLSGLQLFTMIFKRYLLSINFCKYVYRASFMTLVFLNFTPDSNWLSSTHKNK